MDLKAEKKSLRRLLGMEDEQFRIPHYQRPYSWTSEQVDDLWDDLLTNVHSGHFLGSLVLAAEDESQPQVIDGQQRLTTLMILLAVLRDACRERGMAKEAQQIQKRLIADDFAEGDARYKFRTGASNWHVFRDFVLREQDDPQRRSLNDVADLSSQERDRNKPIANNVVRLQKHLAEQLDNRSVDESREWLSQFIADVMERVELVVIEVKELADAFLLFETLNDRGLQLSAADLLKSHLLGRFAKVYTSNEDVEEAARQWDGMLEDLGASVDVSRFLRHYLLGFTNTVKKDDVFGHFKALIAKRDPQWVLDELRTVARLYGEFENPARVAHEETRDVLADLQTLRAMTCYVALLPARRYLSETDFVEFARVAEVLTFRYSSVVGLGTNDLERRYRDAAQVLIQSEGADIASARRILIDTMPDSQTFKGAFARMRMGTQYLLRYTLRRLEAHLDTGVEKKLQPNNLVHIEHIMPQTLTEAWREALGVTGVEHHAEYLNRYGNLTLFYYGYNIPASNKTFEEKKQYYRESDVLLTRELVECRHWGPNAIEARQVRLGELADRVWAIPQVGTTSGGMPDAMHRFESAVGDLWTDVERHCLDMPATAVQGWSQDLPRHLHDHVSQAPLAQALAERLSRLANGWPDYNASERRVLAGAVGYFLAVDDRVPDTGVGGLDDDDRVISAAERTLSASEE